MVRVVSGRVGHCGEQNPTLRAMSVRPQLVGGGHTVDAVQFRQQKPPMQLGRVLLLSLGTGQSVSVLQLGWHCGLPTEHPPYPQVSLAAHFCSALQR